MGKVVPELPVGGVVEVSSDTALAFDVVIVVRFVVVIVVVFVVVALGEVDDILGVFVEPDAFFDVIFLAKAFVVKSFVVKAFVVVVPKTFVDSSPNPSRKPDRRRIFTLTIHFPSMKPFQL